MIKVLMIVTMWMVAPNGDIYKAWEFERETYQSTCQTMSTFAGGGRLAVLTVQCYDGDKHANS